MVRQVIATPLVYKSYIWYSPEQAAASYHYHRQLTNALERATPSGPSSSCASTCYEARDVLAQHMEAVGGRMARRRGRA